MNTTIKALLLVAVVFGFIIFRMVTHCNCECDARKYVVKEEYTGYVVRKVIDHKNHGARYYVLNDSTKVYVSNYDVFDTLQPDDYLIKHKGSLKHWLIRRGDTTLFYPRCEFYKEGIHDVTDEPFKSKSWLIKK